MAVGVVTKASKKWQTKRDVHTKSYQNPFFKEKKDLYERIPWNLLNIILSICIFFVGLYIIFISPWFRIKAIDMSDLPGFLITDVHTVLINSLNEKYFGLFSQDNVFLFDLVKAQKSVISVVGVEDVDVSIKKGVLKVSIHQGDGVIRWLSGDNGIYSVNARGVVLRKIQDDDLAIISKDSGLVGTSLLLEPNLNEPIVSTFYKSNVKIGQVVVGSSIISSLLYLDKNFTDRFLTRVKSYIIEDEYSRQIMVETIMGVVLFITLPEGEFEINEMLDRLSFFVNQKYNGNLRSLRSIDLRYGEKIFYY